MGSANTKPSGATKFSSVDDEEAVAASEKNSLFVTSAAWLCDAIESAVLWMVPGAKPGDNYYLSGNYGPVPEFAPQQVLAVKGDLPGCLNGEFVRVGPNPKLKPIANYHWFDGDGMLHGLRIKDGEVTFVSRYVKTSRLKQEQYWDGAKFMKIGDLMGRMGLFWVYLYILRVKTGVLDDSNGNGPANTALTYHNGRLLSLNESDKPYAIRVLEDGDLETIGRIDYDKKLNHSFTAHPKIDPVTGEMFTFGYQTRVMPHATYRVVSKDGVMSDPVPLTISGPVMMHDFAITENYSIFMDLPLYFNPKDMVAKNQFIFEFDATKPSRFGVLPRYATNESQMLWFERPTCFIFHNANAWEEGDEVVLVTCRLPHINLGAVSVYDEEITKDFVNELWEFRFNVRTGEATDRKLGEFNSDFPRINEDYVGRKNRYVYATVFEDATHIIGLVKYDLTLEPELGKKQLEVGGNVAGVFWHGSQRFGSEAVYIPKKPGREVEEDDGYLMCFVRDEKNEKSEVLVIDAKTMSSEPVAVIEMPARVPYGFHAMFVTEDQLQSQR